jgi:nitrite reductase (NADH) small subunit
VIAASPVYNLGPVDRIPPGEGRAYRLGDELVAVFRLRDGRLFATQGPCPHQGGPLADGIVGAGKVLCPLHARRFDLATGRSLGGGCPDLVTYTVSVDGRGDLIVSR